MFLDSCSSRYWRSQYWRVCTSRNALYVDQNFSYALRHERTKWKEMLQCSGV